MLVINSFYDSNSVCLCALTYRMCNSHQNLTTMNKSFIALIEQSIKDNWELDALTDYKGSTLRYKDIARKIEKMHIILEISGIKKGDKIAICGRNSAHWVVAFLGVITYGAVAVPILHEFKPDNVHYIVNHSEARLLFVGDQSWENFNEACMPALEAIIGLKDFSILVSRSAIVSETKKQLNALFGNKYPKNFRSTHICYRREEPEELAIINYTSGTTGYSKGVMLPYRSILSNVMLCRERIHIKAGDSMVSMLPLGHVFGMTFDFLFGICQGAHLWFLTRMPSPKIIAKSFSEIRPRVISCVPLVIEKIFKKNILPKVDTTLGRFLLKVPLINDKIKTKAREEAMSVFGGNFIEIIIGGAPFNAEVEAFLRRINFPYTIAYGMTECGPIICHNYWENMKYMSCGQVVPRMKIKILSSHPYDIPGEIVCRGENVMLGYYKNEEATRQVIDEEGWLHTGDMATMDEDGFIYIKGRCKNMLLTSSGQNIYPEEIESKLNNMLYVSESIVILNHEKLIALVYPDWSELGENIRSPEEIERLMEQNRHELNQQLPTYSQISRIKIWPEEFEKTAKKSIKRYLYQDVKL